METKEPTGPDFQRQLRHLEEQVDQNRHDLDALMQRADDSHARADAADARADEQRARTDGDRDRISALEAALPSTGSSSRPSMKTASSRNNTPPTSRKPFGRHD